MEGQAVQVLTLASVAWETSTKETLVGAVTPTFVVVVAAAQGKSGRTQE